MATGGVLSIANRALLSVGARAQVSSFSPSDGSAEADALSVLWTPTFESLARAAQWNCLRKQVTLSLLAAAANTPENPDGTTLPVPPTPWLYAYAYPSDCLAVRYLVPSFPANTGSSTPDFTINNNAPAWIPGGGQIVYQVSTFQASANAQTNTVILTNQDLAQAVYTANIPNPAYWDSLFQAAMVASLAAFLVPALSLSLPLMTVQVQLADRIISQARARDGNEGVTVMDHTPDWILARAGSGGSMWGGNSGLWNNGCYDMNWPAG